MKITRCWNENKFLTENSSWEARFVFKREENSLLDLFHSSSVTLVDFRDTSIHAARYPTCCVSGQIYEFDKETYEARIERVFWTSFKDDPRLWDESDPWFASTDLSYLIFWLSTIIVQGFLRIDKYLILNLWILFGIVIDWKIYIYIYFKIFSHT